VNGSNVVSDYFLNNEVVYDGQTVIMVASPELIAGDGSSNGTSTTLTVQVSGNHVPTTVHVRPAAPNIRKDQWYIIIGTVHAPTSEITNWIDATAIVPYAP
jgi:hypothetical protein